MCCEVPRAHSCTDRAPNRCDQTVQKCLFTPKDGITQGRRGGETGVGKPPGLHNAASLTPKVSCAGQVPRPGGLQDIFQQGGLPGSRPLQGLRRAANSTESAIKQAEGKVHDLFMGRPYNSSASLIPVRPGSALLRRHHCDGSLIHVVSSVACSSHVAFPDFTSRPGPGTCCETCLS